MPYCDPRAFAEKDQAVYDGFIQRLGQFGSWLIRGDYSVTLFGTDIGIDPLPIDDLLHNLYNEGGIDANLPRVVKGNASSLDELLDRMSLMDYVVTCRFHGIVFAHMLNKPVLAISHHPKMVTLMKELGLGSYCVDIRTFDLNLLAETFAALVRDTAEIKRRMAWELDSYRQQLAVQMDELFPKAA